MKTACIFFLICMTNALMVSAQAPQAFNYQGVARDSDGDPLTDQDIGILLSILSGAINGPIEYQEEHSVLTDASGHFALKIGEGTPNSGSFAGIDWGADSYFLNLGMDPLGGVDFVEMGTSQFLSVPYALYADSAGYSPNTGYSTFADTLLTPASNGQTLYYNDGFWTASSRIYNSDGFSNVGIGTTTPGMNAILDLSAVDKGFFTPRLTTLQRLSMAVSGLSNQGLLLYDADLENFVFWNGNAWKTMQSEGGSTSTIPTGLISMWSGTITSIPVGYALCDGSNGTPDLTDKFIVSVSSSAENPGIIPVTGLFVDVETGATVAPDRQFFKLAYIMKL